MLPHRAAAPWAASRKVHLKDEAGTAKVNNNGVQDAVIEVFSLINTSPKIDREDLPGPGSNMAVVDLKAVGVRGDVFDGVLGE